MLHYFGSKENLIIAVLQERDVRDIAAGLSAAHSSQPVGDGVQRSVDRTQASPGLARLYTAFAAAATDPAHPANEFFRRRYDDIRETTRRGIEAAISEGRVDPAVDTGRPVSRSSASSTGCSSSGCSTQTSTPGRRCAERYRLSSHHRLQPTRPPSVTPHPKERGH